MIDMMKTHVLNQLEEESADSQFGALMRSKNFWYCVFGLIFFLWMGALILWVAPKSAPPFHRQHKRVAKHDLLAADSPRIPAQKCSRVMSTLAFKAPLSSVAHA